MHRSKVSIMFIIKFILISFLVHKSYEFNIPDQHLTLGKLFYYKLNMTKEQKDDVTKIDLIKISDSGPAKLPSWLIFHNFTFIGFPIQQDNIKFISIVINYKKYKTLRDVFLINGIDSGQVVTTSNSKSSSSVMRNDFDSSNNCEIKLDKAFDTADDLWKLIVYLMPKYLSELMLNDDYKTNSNQAITDWARDLFTITGVQSDDGKLAYNLLISNLPCARDLNDYDDIQYKLTKIGVQFSVVKNVQNTKESTDDEDDEDYRFFNGEKLMLNDMAAGSKNRRQIQGKRLPAYATRTEEPSWMTILSTTTGVPFGGHREDATVDTNRLDHITRIQASLSTPELPYTNHHLNPDLATPHYNYPASVLSNIYSTPIDAPLPPTDPYLTTTDNNLITPTPTLTFIVSDTARELSSFESNSISPSSSSANLPVVTQSISPPFSTPTDQLPTTLPTSSKATTSYSFNTTVGIDVFRTSTTTSTTTTTTTTQKPAAKKPKIYSGTDTLPDHAPIIKERIPKLRLISGVYWRYAIPEETFSDFEKGNTRNLELSFAPIDKNSENIAPADLFIQFDRENQVLTALPAENHIGRHKFTLTAADSSGQMVSDELEISVVQHKLSRSFTHKFMLENVAWNSDIPLVDAVYNLMKKIATLFKDRNVDSIFLQEVESVRTENEKRIWNIYWTNSSLRTYPCPSQEIQSIFSKLAQQGAKFKEGKSFSPNSLLRKITEPEYQIGQVKVTLASTCTKIDTNLLKDKTPQVRNPIKNISFELGTVFNYQVPSDTFISSRQTDTKDLALELVSPSGYIVDKRDCIGFSPENQTIYGLTLSDKLINENLDYRLIARDLDSNLNAYDVFVLQILEDKLKGHYTHEIILQFKSQINVEMDLYSKVSIANKFANAVFNGDVGNLKVLKIKRHRYEPQYKTNKDYNRRKRESTTTRTFYEYVLSVKSFASSSQCPADRIQRDVVTRIFNASNVDPEARLSMLRDLFLPDYELVYVGFRSTGKCKNQISPTYIGTRMVAESKSDLDESTTTTELSLPSNIDPSQRPSTDEDEILLRTIVPAILIIIIILLISCIIIVMLVRFRRNQDKNRFEVNSNMHGVGEAESFLQKGRNPVILESDLNPSMHLLAQQQVYNPMTPMKQFNRNPYASHEPHRRPPPQYMGAR